MNNKIYLLNLYPNNHNIFNFLFIILFILLVPLSFFIKIYDSYYTTGLISCNNDECSITISLPYDKVEILKQTPHIEYLNKGYEITSIDYNEPYLNNQVPYEDITIKTNLSSKDQIINFKILYNKQRIVRKIISIVKGE